MHDSHSVDLTGSPASVYASYQLSKAVECNTALREFIKSKVHHKAQIIPVRVGFKGKFTSQGIIRCLNLGDTPLRISAKFRGTRLVIGQITESEYKDIKKVTSRKVYFRGFPLDAGELDVLDIFGQFGKIEFVYFMKESRAIKRTNRQGYFIYEQHHSLQRLLENKSNLKCRGRKIYYEEYNATKDNLELKSGPNSSSIIAAAIKANPQVIDLESIIGVTTNGTSHGFSDRAKKARQVRESSFWYSNQFIDCTPRIHSNSNDVCNIRINLKKPDSLASDKWLNFYG